MKERIIGLAVRFFTDKKLFWSLYLVIAAVFAAATLYGTFSRDLPPRLPNGYENSRTRSFSTMERETFLGILKERPKEITNVKIFGKVPTIVIQRDDMMHESLVNFGSDAADVLPEQLRAKEIKYQIGEHYEPTWADEVHPAFWIILSILGVGGVVALIRHFPIKEENRTQTGYHPGMGMGGLGLGAAAGGGAPAAAQEATPEEKKTFADVAGCDEAIEKLLRVRKWLRQSFWFNLFGAKIPKGILLLGPPGTGKTLLARALAGETDANFFSISASEFVEMYVGVGARRVRDIFDKAKAARKKTGKPSIIFIDELDAVGKKRTSRGGGGDSERDQTLNQILTCMQGFKPSSGILVVAATNLAETLDPALLRPGRFDYHVSVDYPDIQGREKIFAIHTRGMTLGEGLSIRSLAVRTPGMSGAHIELVCSEAGVIAAERLEHLTAGLDEEAMKALPRIVTLEDFDRAIDFVQFGDELLSRMRTQTEDDRFNTSVHEAGHAVMTTATGGDPVTKLTRTIRSKSLGMMQAHSEGNRYGMKEEQMLSRIITAMGGQAAQLLILGFKDTGASNDFEQANRLARFMVGAYGMSPLGPIQIKLDDQGFPAVPLSPMLASKFDKAWMAIIAECWEKTQALTKEHEERIKRIGKALLVEETILADRYRELYDGKAPEVQEAAAVTDSAPVGGSAGGSIPDATGHSL
jgi:cell division protease FtsH